MREAIEIVVRSDGTRVVRRQIDDIGKSSARTHTAVQMLKRGLATLGGFYAVRELARAVDQYNSLNNRLSVVSGSIDQVKSSYAELLAISNRTLIPLQETTVLFQRAAIAADQLGASNRDLFKFVETVGQALAIQGGNASTARGALLQLSQAIGTDIVRAEEFNSILEGAFPIALAAARGIDAAAGSVARLRKMVIEGEVTSKEFFAAIMSQSDELAAQFAKITPTMAQGFNVLSNGWVTFMGRLDESLGVSRAISQAMIWLGENMMEVGNAAVAAAAGLTILFGPAMLSMVTSLTKRVGLFNAVLLANPLVTLLAALVAVVTYLTLMQDQIMLGTDAFQRLGDLMTVFWLDTKAIFNDLKEVLYDWFGPAIESVKDFLSEYDLSVVGILRATADVGDNIIGVYVGAFHAIMAVWNAFPAAFIGTMKAAIQPVADMFEDLVNELISASNKMRDLVGLDLISEVNFDLGGGAGDPRLGDLGKVAGDAFMEGFEGSTNIRDYLEGAIDRSRLVSAARLVKEATPPGDVLRTPPPGGSGDDEGAAKALKKLNSELEALVKRYDSIAAAQIELAQTEDTLNRAVDKGLISRTRATDLMERARDALQDQLDPLGKVVRDLEEEARLIQMSATEREVYNRVQTITNGLKEAGVRLTEAETRALTEEVSILERAARLEAARQNILQDVHGDMLTYNTNMTALNQLLRDGAINMEQYNEQAKKFQEALPGASNELDVFAENLARNTQDVFADFLFNPFEDGLKGMADSFTAMVQRLIAEAVAADLTRRLFGQLGVGTGSGWVGAAAGAIGGMFGGTPVAGGFMSEVMTFDGGGYTGDGPRTGGLDGKGGYLAMVHPQETVVDHTKAGQDSGTEQRITNNFILEDRKDRRTQQQLAMKAAQAQRRANSRLGS